MNKTVIVTGGNKGLGFELCKQMAQLGNQVILTSRDVDKGVEAIDNLKNLNLVVNLHILDIDSQSNIEAFVREVKDVYGTVDILYNNAAILPEMDRNVQISKLNIKNFQDTMQTNFLGPLYLIQLLLPLIPKNWRIINIGARPSLFHNFKNNGNMSAYRISKLAFHAMTVLLSDELKERNIVVVAVHPGWVRTDMGGDNAHRSVEEGAETPIWLSNDELNPVSGAFYLDKEIIDW